MTRRSVILWVAVSVATITAVAFGVVLLIRSARMPQSHLIPEGYRGWVSVAYAVREVPPLPIEDGYQVFRYDNQGTLETSSPFEEGWGVADYFYVAGETRTHLPQRPPGFEGGRIWGNYTSTSIVTRVRGELTRKGVRTGFFVGTEDEYHQRPRP